MSITWLIVFFHCSILSYSSLFLHSNESERVNEKWLFQPFIELKMSFNHNVLTTLVPIKKSNFIKLSISTVMNQKGSCDLTKVVFPRVH